eukprot:14245442-Ditylum_brightwellii.AAC.1
MALVALAVVGQAIKPSQKVKQTGVVHDWAQMMKTKWKCPYGRDQVMGAKKEDMVVPKEITKYREM